MSPLPIVCSNSDLALIGTKLSFTPLLSFKLWSYKLTDEEIYCSAFCKAKWEYGLYLARSSKWIISHYHEQNMIKILKLCRIGGAFLDWTLEDWRKKAPAHSEKGGCKFMFNLWLMNGTIRMNVLELTWHWSICCRLWPSDSRALAWGNNGSRVWTLNSVRNVHIAYLLGQNCFRCNYHITRDRWSSLSFAVRRKNFIFIL